VVVVPAEAGAEDLAADLAGAAEGGKEVHFYLFGSMKELSFQHYLLGLFAVANNIAAIPLYISLIAGQSNKDQLKLCRISTFTAFLTMMVAMYAGIAILTFFDISLGAFRIAGGWLLVGTGMSMMSSSASTAAFNKTSFSKVISSAVIPIGIPMTTGAGAMSTVILFAENMGQSLSHQLKLIGAIVVMTIIIFLSFRFAPKIIKLLGETGLDVLTKIFGLITLALGIQFIITGLSASFPKLL
jgi:multiple antibiotic resistance protein